MTLFRALLLLILIAIVGYTVPVIAEHGMGPLFPTFFGDIAKFNWPGQFNLDFMGFLLLSGTWLAWRNNFSPLGLVLGAFGLVGGAPLLTTYLLIVSFNANGDWAQILLGEARAQRLRAG